MVKPEKNSLLIVDDDSENITALVYMLQAEYTIYVAKSGHHGIDLVREHMPDLILLDILMPEMDGFEFLITLKKSFEFREIPVIFITGLDSKSDEEKGLSYGAADYISKPFHPGIVRLRVWNQIKIVNQIRTIQQLSMIDQLTGIPNRRSFDHQMNLEWKRVQRENQLISLLMMDVDKFKVFNDTYGHLSGDVVLQSVAATLAGTLKRASDFAARWGGEEFAALLPNTDVDGGMLIAESVRENIESLTIKLPNDELVKVTLSIGVNTISPAVDSDMNAFIAGSDMALYVAKELGRNRVYHYRDAVMPEEL